MIENDINDDTLKLPLCNGLAEVNLPIYGLCYKHMMSVNYAPSVVNKLKALLTDDINTQWMIENDINDDTFNTLVV